MRGAGAVATDGAVGFDCNSQVTAKQAALMVAADYAFVLRYVGRIAPGPDDIHGPEITRLLDAGLSVMAVQHVESEESWGPTADKGALYGANAVRFAFGAGILPGTTLWCDLEGVAEDTPMDWVVGYCQAWYHSVLGGGYQPGLYVGWHCGLTPVELYRLPFEHYWAAYNLNTDEYPVTRGVQMKQRTAKKADIPDKCTLDFQVDIIEADAHGGLPVWHAP